MRAEQIFSVARVMSLYVLFESALGFSVFETNEASGIALDSPSIQVWPCLGA